MKTYDLMQPVEKDTNLTNGVFDASYEILDRLNHVLETKIKDDKYFIRAWETLSTILQEFKQTVLEQSKEIIEYKEESDYTKLINKTKYAQKREYIKNGGKRAYNYKIK